VFFIKTEYILPMENTSHIELRDRILYAIKDKPNNWTNYANAYQLCEQLRGDIPNTEIMDFTVPLKQAISEHLKSGDITNSDIQSRYIQLIDDVLLIEARCLRFDSYMAYLEKDRQPQERFWLPRREQLLSVVNDFQDLIDDKLDVYILAMPPGTAKTTLIKFLISMIIGSFPDSHNITSGYSQRVTNMHYEGVLSILTDNDTYRWNKVYPHSKKIITDANELKININKKHPFANLTCRSIDGSLTGATRANKLLVMDDMVDGLVAALSATRMQGLNNKVETDLLSRMMENCKIIAIQTPWSVNDNISWLIRRYQNSKDVKVRIRRIPLLDDNDESNFQYQYDLGYSTKRALLIRDTTDEPSYRALYDVNPIERDGILFPVDDLQYYFELPNKEPDEIVAAADTKTKGTDYFVCMVAYKYGSDIYIADILCDEGGYEASVVRVANMLMQHKVKQCLVESNSAGEVIADNIDKLIKEKNGRVSILKRHTKANKETKIHVNAPDIKSTFYFKDTSAYKDKSDYGKFMANLTSYSVTGKSSHDDAPDCASILNEYICRMEGSKVEVFKRPF
jgi:predicted phage terminase large subunit-like protein